MARLALCIGGNNNNNFDLYLLPVAQAKSMLGNLSGSGGVVPPNHIFTQR